MEEIITHVMCGYGKIMVVTCSDSALANIGLHCGKTWRLLNRLASTWRTGSGWWGGAAGIAVPGPLAVVGGLVPLLSPPPPHSQLLPLLTEIRTQLVEQFKCLEQQSESRLQLLLRPPGISAGKLRSSSSIPAAWRQPALLLQDPQLREHPSSSEKGSGSWAVGRQCWEEAAKETRTPGGRWWGF